MKKTISIILIAISAYGCKDVSQSSAEKAIEEKQNQVWITRLDEAKNYFLKLSLYSSKPPSQWDTEMTINCVDALAQYGTWRKSIEIDSKITKIPRQLQTLLVDVDGTQSIARSNCSDANSLMATREDEKKRKKESDDYLNALKKIQDTSRRSARLDWALEASKQDLAVFEEKMALWSGRYGPPINTVKLIPDASGRVITFGPRSGNFLNVQLKLQNTGMRSGESSNVTQVFLTFTTTELAEGESCKYKNEGTPYIYKKYLQTYISPSKIEELSVLVPDFFIGGSCIGVIVSG